MIAGAGLYILSSIAYILAPPFWPFLIVRILQGLGLAFFSTASFTLMANIAAGIHQGQVISYYYMSFNFAFALAPYFGMVLINQFNFTVLFLVCAGLSLCALVITAKMGKMERPLTEDRSIQNQPIWSREFLPPILMAFSLNLIWSSLGAFFPLYALRHGVSNPGIFFTVYAIALIVGRGFGGRILDTYERRRVMIPCLITVVLSLVLLTFSTTLGMFVVAGLILGSGWSLLYPCLALYVIENAGPARGPAMSIFTALGDLGAGIGPMVMGIVLQWTSYPAMFGCLILIGVLNLLFFCSVTGKGRWGSFFRWPVAK
jgi:MFS family permease